MKTRPSAQEPLAEKSRLGHAAPPTLEVELAQRTAELELVGSVQQALAARLGMQEIYDLVGDRIRDLFDAQVVIIRTFDADPPAERLHYAFEKGERFFPEPRPADRFSYHLMSLTEPLVVHEDFGGFMRSFGEIEDAVFGEAPRSAVFVPLMSGGEVRGNVSLQNVDREHAFSEADVRLLGTLANSMSLALENAQLFDETSRLLGETNRLLAETEQRNAELAVINAVQEGLVAEVNMQGIYDLVGDRIRDIFDAQSVGIYTFDPVTDAFHVNYLFEDGQRHHPEPRPMDALRRRLASSPEIIVINEDLDATLEALTGEDIPNVPGTASPRSAVYVPMLVGESVRGYITLQNLDREHAFSTSDVQLLGTLTSSMTMALENARLFDETNRLLAETEQRNAELAVINAVQEGLVAELDMQAIYDLVGNRILQIFDAQVVAIATFDFSAGTENFRYLFEDGERLYPEARPYNKLRQRLIDTKQLILINRDAAEALRAITGDQLDSVPGTRVAQSMLFVPLVVGEVARGYVTLQNLDREDVFSASDVRLLSTLANSMSVALENARLFDETNRLLAETEQRNAELAVINSVQEGLVAELDMQGIYDLVGDRIREIFDAQSVVIRTFDLERSAEHWQYAIEKGERQRVPPRPLDGFSHHLLGLQGPLVLNQGFIEFIGQFSDETAVEGETPKSAVFVPLRVGDAVTGNISLQNVDQEGAFSEADVRLLSTLANSMSIALENARLFDETNRLLAETELRNAELAVINGVQAGIVGELDEQAIYDLVGERLRELDAQSVSIATFDHAAGTERFNFLFEQGARHHPEPRPFNALRRQLIESRRFILINEGADRVTQAVEGTAMPKSMLFVPMISGDVVRGYISIQNLDREHAFGDSDVRLLTTLGNSMSVALENARLFAETHQQAAELDTVNRVSRALVAQLDLDVLVHLVGEQMRETFQADIVYVALLDREAGMIRFPYVYGEDLDPVPFGEGLTSQILETAEPLLINTDFSGRTQKLGVQYYGKHASSYLGVPIIAGTEAIGVISVQSTEKENVFDEDDQRLLSTIASNVGIALQNARSYNQLSAALAELKRTQAQLVQQEKLASLGALAAGVAHEIKNPLNFINNFSHVTAELAAELLELHREQPLTPLEAVAETLDDLKLNAQKIVEHGKRADGIVRSMLEHSRGQKGDRKAVDLNSFLDEYVSLAYHGARAQKPGFDVQVAREFEPEAGEVSILPQEMGRVLLNLLNNAFYAVEERRASATGAYRPQVWVSTRRATAAVEIRIRDNGSGIPEAIRQKIFEPFFTTKPTGSGTGLGLSLSYEIITQGHSGSLSVDSDPGHGTEFVIALPV